MRVQANTHGPEKRSGGRQHLDAHVAAPMQPGSHQLRDRLECGVSTLDEDDEVRSVTLPCTSYDPLQCRGLVLYRLLKLGTNQLLSRVL